MRACTQPRRPWRSVNTLAGLTAALFLTLGDTKGAAATGTALLPVPPASVLPLLFSASPSRSEEPRPAAPTVDLTPAAASPRPEQIAVNPLDALSPYLPGPGEWRQVTGLRFDHFGLTDQEANALNIRGTGGSAAVLSQQTGSAYDPEGFFWYFWGGGGGSYGGNEVYRLDLTIPLMTQLTQPSILDTTVTASNASSCLAPSDGPAAGSTFDGFVWSSATQSFFVFPTGAYCPTGTYNQETIWEFDPLAGTWDPIASMTGLNGPVFAEYDSLSGLIYVVETGANATLRDFDPVTGHLGARVNLGITLSVGNAVLDTRTDELIVFAQEGVYSISMSNPGAINRLADVPSGFDTASGAALDLQRGIVALWAGGTTVRSFDTATNAWTEEIASSGPVAGPGGVFSKWTTIKELGLFAGYHNPAEGLWLYRLPTTLTAPPPGNSAPVAFVGNSQIAAHTGNVVNLDGSGSFDPDGDPLTYAWSTISSPAGNSPSLTTPGQAATSFTPAVDGGYVLRLTVSDGALSDTVTVTVTAGNAAPVANAGPDQTLTEGQTAALSGLQSSDPDGDSLSYAWVLATQPAGSTASLSSTTAAQPTLTLDVPGNYRARLTVSDGLLTSSFDEVTITAEIDLGTAGGGSSGAGFAVTALNLINSDTNQAIGLLQDGLTIDLAVAGRNLNVGVDVSGVVESIAFDLSGSPLVIENNLPYAMAGDTGGNFNAWTPPVGSYQLTATPYSLDNGGGSAGQALTVSFTVTDSGGGGGSTGGTPPANDAALLAHWAFDENSGALAGDSAGSNTGTIFGGTWASGVVGSALSFGGSDYVVVDNTPELDITGTAITMAAWIKPSDGGVTAGSRIISKRTDAGGCDVYSMFTLANEFWFRLDCQTLIASSGFLPDGWIHVAMVYDGTVMRTYLNGVQDSATLPKGDPIDSSARAVHLGMREGEGRHFSGLIDDARIYDRALSAAEVTDLFNAAAVPANQLATITAAASGGTSGGGSTGGGSTGGSTPDGSPPGRSATPYKHVTAADVGVNIGHGVLAAAPTIVYSGPLTLTSPSTIENRIINGCLRIDTSNVTIRNVIINCNSHFAINLAVSGNHQNFTIEYSTIRCNSSGKIFMIKNYQNITINNNETTGCEDFFFVDGNIDGLVVRDNYMHSLNLVSLSHADGFQIGEFVNPTTGFVHIQGNWMHHNSPGGNNKTALIFATNFSQVDILLEDNFIPEFGFFIVRCHNQAGCNVRNNIWEQALINSSTAFLLSTSTKTPTFSCNRYEDGNLVNEFRNSVDRVVGTFHITNGCPTP